MKASFAIALALLSPAAAVVARADDSAYYKQFLYTESTDADGNVSTRFLMASGFDVGMSDRGHVVGIADLFLLQDGSFVLKWKETTDQGFPVDFGDRFEGKWSVPSDTLLLTDPAGLIATGNRAVYNGRNAVQLTFQRDLHTPGLKGKSAVLDFGFSNSRPGDP